MFMFLLRVSFGFHFCFISLLISLFFTDETEDDDTNKEYIEETNRDAVMIAAAKLVASDTVSKVSILLLCMMIF